MTVNAVPAVKRRRARSLRGWGSDCCAADDKVDAGGRTCSADARVDVCSAASCRLEASVGMGFDLSSEDAQKLDSHLEAMKLSGGKI